MLPGANPDDLLLQIRKAAGNGQYNQVYILSQRIAGSMDTLSPEVRRYRWMAMVELEMFSECRDELMVFAAADSILSGRIQALPLQIRQKSPQRAQRLSARCPGLGQVYAGYPLQGAVSFLLHAGSLFLTWKAFESGLYVNGALFGIYPFYRFYQGGKTYSYSLADRSNQKRMKALKHRYLEVVGGMSFLTN